MALSRSYFLKWIYMCNSWNKDINPCCTSCTNGYRFNFLFLRGYGSSCQLLFPVVGSTWGCREVSFQSEWASRRQTGCHSPAAKTRFQESHWPRNPGIWAWPCPPFHTCHPQPRPVTPMSLQVPRCVGHSALCPCRAHAELTQQPPHTPCRPMTTSVCASANVCSNTVTRQKYRCGHSKDILSYGFGFIHSSWLNSAKTFGTVCSKSDGNIWTLVLSSWRQFTAIKLKWVPCYS